MVIAVAFPTPLAAQVRPTPGSGDPHLQTVEYKADQVVQLAAALGYQVTVALSPDEQIETVAVGDSAAWQVTPSHSGDHLFVKLLQQGGATDMTVVTNVRRYAFELAPLSAPASDMAYTVQFHYPTPPALAAAPSRIAGYYKLTGARTLMPSRISDDGQRTFVEWPKDVDLPAVYAIDARGHEALINGMMRDDRLVIDAVVPRLVFRIDQQIARAVRLDPKKQR